MYDMLMSGVSTFVTGLDWKDAGLALMHVTTGTFFAISGFHKLFNKDRHASLVETLKSDGVPFVKVNQWFVPSVEFLGGTAMVAGLFTPLMALMLFCICFVATCVDGLKRVKDYSPIDKADYIDDVLYLPEVGYAISCIVLIFSGGGAYSVDAFIKGMF